MAGLRQELLTVDEDVLGIGFQGVDLDDLAPTVFSNNDRWAIKNTLVNWLL